METHRHLRLVEPPKPDYPDLYEFLREHRKPTLAARLWSAVVADWREVVSEVRASPVSHLLVAIAAVVLWTGLLIAPLLISGAGR